MSLICNSVCKNTLRKLTWDRMSIKVLRITFPAQLRMLAVASWKLVSRGRLSSSTAGLPMLFGRGKSLLPKAFSKWTHVSSPWKPLRVCSLLKHVFRSKQHIAKHVEHIFFLQVLLAGLVGIWHDVGTQDYTRNISV